MDRTRLQVIEHALFCSGIKIQWSPLEKASHGLFASIGQVAMGMGFGVSPNPQNLRMDSNTKLLSSTYMRYVPVPDLSFRIDGVEEFVMEEVVVEVEEEAEIVTMKNRLDGFGMKVKVGNASLRRLLSGAIAGVVSRTAVAPLETSRTNLMVGSCGNSSGAVFQSIMKADGWQGLYRGNLVNVIGVAPSKGIELFVFDMVNKYLTRSGEELKILIPASSIAGALAGISSTLCTYPLELLKTRLTVQINSITCSLEEICLIYQLVHLDLNLQFFFCDLIAARSVQELLRCIFKDCERRRTRIALQRPYAKSDRSNPIRCNQLLRL